MVKLREYFFNCKYLKKLNEVSDNCCEDNGNKYIDFDLYAKFKETASTDSLIIKDEYLVFIEFKKLDNFDNQNAWLKDKVKNQQILLKGYESYFLLQNLCKELDILEQFYNVEKRFVLVYKAKNAKKKIKKHFKNKLNRAKIAFDDVVVLECKNFINLLQRIENVF